MADESDEKKKKSKVQESRTWDKELYERKARERLEREEAGELEPKERGVYLEAPEDAPRVPGSKRAFLQARTGDLGIKEKIGTKAVITDVGGKGPGSGGFYCEICECTLRDSVSWLDHINGKRHQRRLGFSMRVERSNLSSVKGILSKKANQKRARENESDAPARPSAMEEYEARLKLKAEKEEAEKLAKKAKKLAKKLAKKGGAAPEVAAQAAEGTEAVDSKDGGGAAAPKKEEEPAEEVDPEQAAMMAMMGFSGFGGGAKN